MPTLEILAERDIWKARAEQSAAEVKRLMCEKVAMAEQLSDALEESASLKALCREAAKELKQVDRSAELWEAHNVKGGLIDRLKAAGGRGR